jgi:hypothetical protein
MSEIPLKCPSCSSTLVITELGCTACNTVVSGYYPINPFLRLPAETLEFLVDFIRNRGNIKEMARESGESYWTIRTRLDKVVAEFVREGDSEEFVALKRKDILLRLKRGEIDAAEATRLLQEMGA